MNAKYRVGQEFQWMHGSEVCKARIVDAWRPGGKRNSTMYRVESWPADGSVMVGYYETAHLTHGIEAARKAVQS